MSDDPADLSRLADIVTPPPAPWLPPAPGWLILAGAVLISVLILAAAALRHYRHNAYRRAALAELAAVGAPSDAAGVAAISAILKRTALSAYPRVETAALTGAGFAAFLDRTGGEGVFTRGAAAGMADAALGAGGGDRAAILEAARRWTKRHRGEGASC